MEIRDAMKGPSAQNGDSESGSTLWSRILASTDRRSSRPGSSGQAGSSRRVIVLGSHDSGKSTVIRALARTNSSKSDNFSNNNNSSRRDKGKGVATPNDDLPDLGMNFQYIDLAEDGEGGEDSASRLSVYQIPSTSKSLHSTLLPMALSRDSLLDSLILIILDWEKPWTFLRDLKGWLEAIANVMNDIENGVDDNVEAQETRRRNGQYLLAEARELLDTYLHSYQEPVTKDGAGNSATSLPTSTGAIAEDRPPLPQGTLSTNLGCNIVVVCNKSDCIQTLERSAELTEEMVEHIQQTLRVICLQYGAALFFTSQYHPATFTKLRSYVFHRLHATSTLQAAHSSNQIDASQSAAANIASATRFPFPYRANAVDREQLCIPTGWDSYGKIRVLRDGFDCATTSRGWLLDMGIELDEDDARQTTSTLAAYESLVVDIEASRQAQSKSNAYLEVQDEQDFLRAHHDMLAREIAKQRQQQIEKQQQQSAAAGKPPPSLHSPEITDVAKKFFGSAGLVGPMSSSGLSLPTVEKALDRDGSAVAIEGSGTRRAVPERRESTRVASTASSGQILSPASIVSQQTSPTLPGSPSPTTGGSQNVVLANFFQSLLNSRDSRASGIGSAKGSPGAAPAATGRTATDLNKSASRK